MTYKIKYNSRLFELLLATRFSKVHLSVSHRYLICRIFAASYEKRTTATESQSRDLIPARIRTNCRVLSSSNQS